MQNFHQKLTYINENGISIDIGYSFPYFFQETNGEDGLSSIISKLTNYNQDGSSVVNKKISDRNITLVGILKGNDKTEIAEYRSKLLSAFNNKLKGVLIYELGMIKKKINCIVEDAPRFSNKGSWKYQNFMINLYCPNPFWNDINESSEEINTLVGGFTFPFRFPAKFSSKGQYIKNIINNGDVETPLEVAFRGPAVNPKITNTLTGEFIRVKRTLTSDDVLAINTEFGKKKVEVVKSDGSKQNAFNYIDLNSTFFQLNVGDNILSYSSDDDLQPSSLSIKYNNRYLGV